jgi:anti-sigma B factor antagonist
MCAAILRGLDGEIPGGVMATDSSDDQMWGDAQPFSCHAEILEGGDTLVRAAGELDVHTCSEFQRVLNAAQDRHTGRLVVDLSEVTFIDSTALGVLVMLQRGLPEPLDVVVTRQHLRRVLLITGLDSVFALHSTVAEARRQAA